MPRVLIVEDNPDMRQTLAGYLQGQGYLVVAVDSTEDGIDAVDERDFDLALIDINLPGKSGFDMIEYIRSADNPMPLIALTARSDIRDKLKGFELGVTDYVVKPFNLEELTARMRTHLRQAGPSNTTADVTTASYHLSPERHEFLMADKPVPLTNTEFRILHILMMHHGAVVNTADLVEFVWGESSLTETPPVRIHIANVRRKLGDRAFQILVTIPGIGYKLVDPRGGYRAGTS
jgi:DNA-binding response OmpR family regulator